MKLFRFLLFAGTLIAASSAFSVPRGTNHLQMATVRLESPLIGGSYQHGVVDTATEPSGLPYKIKQRRTWPVSSSRIPRHRMTHRHHKQVRRQARSFGCCLALVCIYETKHHGIWLALTTIAWLPLRCLLARHT
jgi:hypothetical protein